MSKTLIVNADDFGFSEAVNLGILKGMKDGVVTSTTIMANMPGFDHAVELYKQNEGMAVGVHLCLTCYKPLLKTHKTLVDENGYFRKQGEIDVYDEEEMYRELCAQIDKVIASGIRVDHLDSHHHIHTTEKLKPVIQRLYDTYGFRMRGGFTYETDIPHTDLIMDFYDKGISLEGFESIMKELKDGREYDLMCHPAYLDKFLYQTTSYAIKRIDELDLLCQDEVKKLIHDYDVVLSGY